MTRSLDIDITVYIPLARGGMDFRTRQALLPNFLILSSESKKLNH